MPNIVTRPVMARVASTITINLFSVFFDKVELSVSRIVMISFMVRFGSFRGFQPRILPFSTTFYFGEGIEIYIRIIGRFSFKIQGLKIGIFLVFMHQRPNKLTMTEY